jgi:branched-chain amino acid transport system substrate-binding protein
MIQRRTSGLALALAAAASVLAACSGGSDGSPGSGGSAEPPIVLGFANMEGSPAGSFPEARVGAQAAVDRVNDDLGGIGGRPVKLVTCKTNGTAESSQGCAQKLLAAKPVAIVGGVDLGANASVHVIAGAGVPYVTGSPTLGAELTTPGVYDFTGGTAADLLGIGDYLVQQHVTSIHILHEDLPGLLTTAINAAGSIFRSKGVSDVKLVAEKADAPDFAAALTAAAAGSPDAVIVVFPAQACARIMQAAQALSVKAPMYYPGACASPAVVTGREAALSNSYFASGYLPVGASGGDAEADAFRKGVPAAQRSPVSEASYSAVLNVAALMADGAADRAALATKLAATKNEPSVLAHPYTCDGKQLPLLTSVCNSNVRLLQYKSGAFTDVVGDWVNGGELAGLAK